MEILAVNLLTGSVRRRLHGREHLVVPMSLIVPGVLNGSQGPLFYPPEEIQRNPEAWNHVPIVIYHPTRNGQHVSARDPDVLDSQAVGIVLHAQAKGKLLAEGWFDIERVRQVDPRVLNALLRGEPLELSTGLFVDNEPAEEGANFNGSPYRFVARNYRPDHLAILPDQVGACSIKDGCGVFVNSRAKEKNQMRKSEIIDYLITNCDCWQEEDRELLDNFTVDRLKIFKSFLDENRDAQEAVANAERLVQEAQQAQKDQPKEAVVNTEPEPKKTLTDEEWLASAPPSIRSAVQNAMAIEAREKTELVTSLSRNLEGEARERVANRLNRLGLEELRDLQALAEVKQPEEPKAPAANYSGAAVANKKQTQTDPSDILPLPVIDWSKTG